jgi:hypothetical protein
MIGVNQKEDSQLKLSNYIFCAIASSLLFGCTGVNTGQIPLETTYVSTANHTAGQLVDFCAGSPEANAEKEQLRRNQCVRASNLATEAGYAGIRYPLPSTYLLVYSTGKDKLKWEIHTLPDPNKRMSTEPYNYFATLEATFTFDEKTGVLKASKEVSDSTAVPTSLITAVQGVASAAIAAANVPEAMYPAPRLYKIVFRDGEYKFIGEKSSYAHIKVKKGVTIEGSAMKGEDK